MEEGGSWGGRWQRNAECVVGGGVSLVDSAAGTDLFFSDEGYL